VAQDWVFTMYKNILIATDGSELADKAVSHGLKLAKDLRASVTFVVVTEQWSTLDIASEAQDGVKNPIESYEEVQAAWANEVLTSAANLAKEKGLDCETIHLKDHHPAEGIIETVKSSNGDLVVMASRGRRGLATVLLGSTAHEVISNSPVPVLIYRLSN